MKITKEKSINITSESWKSAKKDLEIRAYIEEPITVETTTMAAGDRESFYDLLERATRPISQAKD